jgi:hypothetical protein
LQEKKYVQKVNGHWLTVYVGMSHGMWRSSKLEFRVGIIENGLYEMPGAKS